MLKQILRISSTNLRALSARWGASLVVVASMAGVTGVTIAILAMAQGFQHTLGRAGRADRVVIMKAGEDNGMASAITREQLPVVLSAPGIARTPEGKPLASAQKFMHSMLRERKTGAETSVILRGVSEQGFKVWPEVRIVEGRAFAPGKRELIAGRGARWQFEGLDLGQEVEMVNGPWTVVGWFEAGGSVYESELWGDTEKVIEGFSITGQFASVTAVLESEAAFQAVADFIGKNPALAHQVKRETDYYGEQGGQVSGAVRTLGYGVAGIMALGALFSAINTMYAAVGQRRREIATLRAIGFGGTPIVLSVLLESVLLCIAGALLGGAVAWVLFNGYAISTINWQSGGQVAFAFRVAPSLIGQGVLAACAVGLLGGLAPALRAARLPVAEALRRA